LAYRLAFGRKPEPDEISDAMSFVERQRSCITQAAKRSHEQAGHAAFVDFCHVLLNSNEFLYVD
jgi:hypothetical protein